MATKQEMLTQGICPECGTRPLAHGPWSEAELKAACDDMGMQDAGEFSDCCDDCFVDQVTFGDVAWAQRMAGDRKLVLTEPGGK